MVLDIGKYGLQIANVYLDDLSESKRLQSVRAMLADLDAELPTIITGGFNALRDDLGQADLSIQIRDRLVRAGGWLLACIRPRNYYSTMVREMNKREEVPYLASRGFIDADGTHARPTAPSKLPLFGVDYAMYSDKVLPEGFDVIPNGNLSDHRAILFRGRIG